MRNVPEMLHCGKPMKPNQLWRRCLVISTTTAVGPHRPNHDDAYVNKMLSIIAELI